MKIQDIENQVFQVPSSVFPRPGGTSSAAECNLRFSYSNSPFSFQISRAVSGEVLFDSSSATLVFESQYLRLRTHLPQSPYIYGLGEHTDPFRLKTWDYVRTLWNQDQGVPYDSNLYGSHPFYLEQRQNGSHGVFLLNSNGMDVVINTTADGQQYLEYNTLGGVFDFWFLAGPSPMEAVQQYGEIAGLPPMQPYWGLGFHQCRYGYRDAYNVAEVVYNYSQAQIPLETMWTDIDYMDRRRVFSLDPQRFPLHMMRELVDRLHKNKQQYIMMVDPAVAYQDYPPLVQGLKEKAFLQYKNGSAWLGVVWPGVTVYPDWFAENAQQYWTGQFQTFFDPESGVDIDAVWIDMNEPSNFGCHFPCDDPFRSARGFPPAPPPVREPPRPLPGWSCNFQPPGTSGCAFQLLIQRAKAPQAAMAPLLKPHQPLLVDASSASLRPETESLTQGHRKGLPGRDLLYPKYAIHNKVAWRDAWNAEKGGLSNRTVNTDVIHQNGLAMYDTHNLYGAMLSSVTREAMLSRRPGLRPLVITRSTFAGTGSKVGHWLGDNNSSWDMYRASIRSLLAFASLFQFSMVGSDVCGFGGDSSEELCARWASLGAFSTFYRNHNSMGSIDQEFYRWKSVTQSARKAIDIRYRLLDYIYTAMYRASTNGSPAILPVFFLYPGDQNTWALELQYFYGHGLLVAPVTAEGATSVDVYLPDDTFYDWYSHMPIRGGGAWHSFVDQDVTTIPLLIRAGVILPMRAESANTTADLRNQDFELLIALDDNGHAKGELYLDDGVSIEQEGRISLISILYDNGTLWLSGVFGYQAGVITKITIMGEQPQSPSSESRHKTGGTEKLSRSWETQMPLNGMAMLEIT